MAFPNAIPARLIIEVTNVKGKLEYWVSSVDRAPYLRLGCYKDGPFPSIEAAQASIPVRGQAELALIPIIRGQQHYQEKDTLWQHVTNRAKLLFSLPLDELTERIPLGKPSVPEFNALRDELTLTFAPPQNEIIVEDWEIDWDRAACTGKDESWAIFKAPIEIDFHLPNGVIQLNGRVPADKLESLNPTVMYPNLYPGLHVACQIQ